MYVHIPDNEWSAVPMAVLFSLDWFADTELQ